MRSIVKEAQKAVLFAKVKNWAKSVKSTSLSWYVDLEVKEVIKAKKKILEETRVDPAPLDRFAQGRLDQLERDKMLAEEKRRAEERRRALFEEQRRSLRKTNKMIRAFKAKERRRLRELAKQQRLEKMLADLKKPKNPYAELEAGWLSVTGKPRMRNVFGTKQLRGFVSETKPQQSSALSFPNLTLNSTAVPSRSMFDRRRNDLCSASSFFPRVKMYM